MTKTIKIEKRVKIPAKTGGGRTSKYPFDKMKIGDSFAFPKTLKSNPGTTVAAAAKRLKIKFTVRNVDGVFRVWRVK